MLARENKNMSRREFLARGAALGAVATGLGGFASSCGTAQAADAPLTMPIHTGPWLPSYEKLVDLYEQQTGNQIRLVPYPLEQVLSKQLIDVDAHSGEYDVYLISQSQSAEFWDAEFMTPFEDMDPGFEWPEGVLDYDDICRWDPEKKYFSKNGTVLGFPVVGLIELEFYRGDLYEKLDIEGPPETWEEVISNSKKIRKKEGSDVFGYLIRGERQGGTWNYLSLLRGFGADVFSDPPDDWTVTINSDEAINATEQWLELASLGPPEPGLVTQSSMIALMQGGQAAHMHLTAAAILPLDDPAQSSVPGKVDAAVVPKPESGQHAPTGGVWINAIPAHIPEERKRLAYDFLRWFVGEGPQREYAKAQGIVTNRKVYESGMVEKERSQRALAAINDSTPYVRRGVDYVFGSEVNLIMDQRLNEMASGILTPRKGHRLMAQELEKLVEESGVAS